MLKGGWDRIWRRELEGGGEEIQFTWGQLMQWD